MNKSEVRRAGINSLGHRRRGTHRPCGFLALTRKGPGCWHQWDTRRRPRRRGRADGVAAQLLAGLLVGGGILMSTVPELIVAPEGRSLAFVGAAGLLVGYGTRLGSGCTSGHGVCGLTRFSPRSLIATMTFMATGFLTATALGVFA